MAKMPNNLPSGNCLLFLFLSSIFLLVENGFRLQCIDLGISLSFRLKLKLCTRKKMRIYRQIYGVHGKPEVISVLPNYPKCYHQICWWESTNSCNGSLSFFGCTLKTSFFPYFSLFHPIRSSEWERDGQNEISSHTFWVGKHTLGANILLGFFFFEKIWLQSTHLLLPMVKTANIYT